MSVVAQGLRRKIRLSQSVVVNWYSRLVSSKFYGNVLDCPTSDRNTLRSKTSCVNFLVLLLVHNFLSANSYAAMASC